MRHLRSILASCLMLLSMAASSLAFVQPQPFRSEALNPYQTQTDPLSENRVGVFEEGEVVFLAFVPAHLTETHQDTWVVGTTTASGISYFLSQDPIGLSGGANLYAYANLNPLMFIDPYGLCTGGGLNLWTRAGGLGQAAGGLFEGTAGVVLGIGGSPTVALGLAGAAVATHGVDNMQAGVRQFVTGQPVDAMTSEIFQSFGMSRNAANQANAYLSAAATAGAGYINMTRNTVSTVSANAGRSFNSGGSRAQSNVDPNTLRAGSQRTLDPGRLGTQRSLIQRGVQRHTPIQVTRDGVIFDGHHGVRAAIEANRPVTVEVIDSVTIAPGPPVSQLPMR